MNKKKRSFILYFSEDGIVDNETEALKELLKFPLMGLSLEQADALLKQKGLFEVDCGVEGIVNDNFRIYSTHPLENNSSFSVGSTLPNNIRVTIIRYLFFALMSFTVLGALAQKNDDKFFNLAYGVNSILSVVVGHYFGGEAERNSSKGSDD